MTSEYLREIDYNQISTLYTELSRLDSPFTSALLEAFRQSVSRDIFSRSERLSFTVSPTGLTLVGLLNPRDRYTEVRMSIKRGDGENESRPSDDPERLRAQAQVLKLTGNGTYPTISIRSEDLTLPAGRLGNITLEKMIPSIFEPCPENLAARKLFENVLVQFQSIPRGRINIYLARDL